MGRISAYKNGYWWSNDGLRLHFRDYPAQNQDAASGRPPIVCLPGLTRNARDFEDLADHLSENWRVICVDLRGRGESAYAKDPLSYVPLTYVQDVEALLAQEGVDEFVAFGTSLGGIISMLLASTRPGRIKGLLLNDIGPEINPQGLERIRGYVGQGRSFATWMHSARWLNEDFAEIYPAFTVHDWLTLAKRMMKVTGSGRIVLDYDMRIAEPFAMPGGEAGVDLWPAFNALTNIPMLLVRGQKSDLLTNKTVALMQEKQAQLDVLDIPNIGHAPTLDEPHSRASIAALLARIEANS